MTNNVSPKLTQKEFDRLVFPKLTKEERDTLLNYSMCGMYIPDSNVILMGSEAINRYYSYFNELVVKYTSDVNDLNKEPKNYNLQ